MSAIILQMFVSLSANAVPTKRTALKSFRIDFGTQLARSVHDHSVTSKVLLFKCFFVSRIVLIVESKQKVLNAV